MPLRKNLLFYEFRALDTGAWVVLITSSVFRVVSLTTWKLSSGFCTRGARCAMTEVFVFVICGVLQSLGSTDGQILPASKYDTVWKSVHYIALSLVLNI